MKELIRKLVESYGPSGYEDEIASIIEEEIKPFVDEVQRDSLGNVIAFKKGTSGKKIMFAAHMDEIGLIVTYIDDKGFLRFSNVGGLYPYSLIGERVRFSNGTVGVVNHEKLDDIKDLKLEKMYIDIGVDTKEEAAGKVRIGDVAMVQRHMDVIGSRLVAKSLDDRIGCAILLEAARRIEKPKHDVYFAFTTQEEVGTRGATTAAYGISPDLGVALDVTRTGDTPECGRMEVSLGKGAAIKVKDSNLVAHPKVKNLMAEIAQKRDIPYQFEVLERGGTDAGPIHLTKEGVPSGVISIPCRYVHSASEMVDERDVDSCVRLVIGLAEVELENF